MKPKTNIIVKGDKFKINGIEYVITNQLFNTSKKMFRYVFQSLYDNGKSYSKFQDELEVDLIKHRNENTHLLGKINSL